MDTLLWIERALDEAGLSLYPLSPAVAVASNRLPGAFHSDPADRIIVATARELGATLLTRDEAILAYSGVKARWE
jgi:PIN domain nuclease of toxin-antitoxin system